MPIEAKDWYEDKPDLTSFYQGDIVKDVPVIFLPDKISTWFLLRPNLHGAKLLDDVLGGEMCKWFEAFPGGSPALTDKWQHGEREEFVAAKAKLMNVAIITQSCDLVSRNYYQVAPIYSDLAQPENRRLILRENGLQYTFFYPAYSPSITENSYADLSHITLVPKRYFPKNLVAEKLAARLKQTVITQLQEQLAEYFGRPFGFSARDKTQADAEYACIDCFYSRGQLTKKFFKSGINFTICDICGRNRWLRIVNPDGDQTQQREPVIFNKAQ